MFDLTAVDVSPFAVVCTSCTPHIILCFAFSEANQKVFFHLVAQISFLIYGQCSCQVVNKHWQSYVNFHPPRCNERCPTFLCHRLSSSLSYLFSCTRSIRAPPPSLSLSVFRFLPPPLSLSLSAFLFIFLPSVSAMDPADGPRYTKLKKGSAEWEVSVRFVAVC